MKDKRSFWDRLFNRETGSVSDHGIDVENAPKNYYDASQTKKKVPLPDSSGRSSRPDYDMGLLLKYDSRYRSVNHQFLCQVIPIIRALAYMNPDMSQVLHNITSLGNTGHKILFDKGVSAGQMDDMRSHIMNERGEWAPGQAGINGLVNKFFGQLLIGGALSNEWVPNLSLTGIETNILVNPETIYFVLKEDKVHYNIYQRLAMGYWDFKDPTDMILLNQLTYKYFALNGDTEVPYGIPTWIPALEPIKTQGRMNTNINFVVDQLSLIGFLEALLTKPDPPEGTNDQQYEGYLQNYLTEAKARLMSSLKDGVVVGFSGDHEFKFNSFGKAYENAMSLYENNELNVGSGLKHDMTLLGRSYNTSETQITVIFMKMLSELRNMQNIIAHNLEFGYRLELMLAGYNFRYLKVQFNRSTIQDDLKYQQAEEIKIRNTKDKMILGIINQDTAADELGYDSPAEQEPMVAWEVLAGQSDPATAGGLATDGTAKKAATKKKKTANDKKVREKNKPVPKNK